MSIEQERAEFEAWYQHHHGDRDVYVLDEYGEYADKRVQSAFNVWQARAALHRKGLEALLAERDAFRCQLEWTAQYAHDSIKSSSRDIDDWIGDMEHIENSARAALAHTSAIDAWNRRAALQSQDREDAERYRLIRRKVCIAGGMFHILNLQPRYIAPDAAIELDSIIDHARRIEGDGDGQRPEHSAESLKTSNISADNWESRMTNNKPIKQRRT